MIYILLCLVGCDAMGVMERSGVLIGSAIRFTVVLLGNAILTVGLALIFRSELGSNPWIVLAHGLSLCARIGLGTSQFLVSLACVVSGHIMGIRAGLGTVVTMVMSSSGLRMLIDGGMLPRPRTGLAAAGLLASGILLAGFGTALYVSGGMSGGPRENLTFGVIKVTGMRLRVVRTIIESSVTAVGFLLGGRVGVGTLAYALTLGCVLEKSYILIGACAERVPALRVLVIPPSVRKQPSLRGDGVHGRI